MASGKFDAETNTLTMTLSHVAWTDAMQCVYRSMCAPANMEFLAAALSVIGSLSKAETIAVSVRVANTPGIDARANREFFMQLMAKAKEPTGH